MNTPAANHNTSATEKQQFIVFRLGQEEYALHISEVKEVVSTPPVASIPLAPPYIKGVANIRGNIMAIVDMEQRLGISQNYEHLPAYTLVIESLVHKMGLLAREVPNTLIVNSSLIDYNTAIPAHANGQQGFVKGIINTDNRLIILLDIDKLIREEEIAV
jgi:purine-binding chemotaxis protein CheW